jgi:hypothetical protein
VHFQGFFCNQCRATWGRRIRSPLVPLQVCSPSAASLYSAISFGSTLHSCCLRLRSAWGAGHRSLARTHFTLDIPCDFNVQHAPVIAVWFGCTSLTRVYYTPANAACFRYTWDTTRFQEHKRNSKFNHELVTRVYRNENS